jgi:hypothetical protein
MMHGFPGLGLLTGAGQSLALVVTRQTAAGWHFPAIPETTIALAPGGGLAAFGMEWITEWCLFAPGDTT